MFRYCLISVSALIGVGVWCASFVLYLSTLAPTLTWGWHDFGIDGGEFLAAAKTFGIPHPPGYPTYTLLLKLFATISPFGDFAYRGNLLSAVFGSFTVLTVYLTSLRVAKVFKPDINVIVAATGSALGALTLAASPLFWSQATITEVYTLNTLFVGLLLLITVRLVLNPCSTKGPPNRFRNVLLMLFGFIFGIGLGNHFTLLVVGVPLFLWLWKAMDLRASTMLRVVLGLSLGLMIYMYLPLRAAHTPPINWGNTGTLDGFVWMLSGAPYQTYLFGVSLNDIPGRLLSWLDIVFSQFNPLGLFIGIIGMRVMFSYSIGFFLTGLVSVIGISVYMLTYNTIDFPVLLLPALMIFSVWIGIGSSLTMSKWFQSEKDKFTATLDKAIKIRLRYASFAIVMLVFVLVPGLSVVFNYETQNLSDDWTATQHARQIVDVVPDGSVIFANKEKNVFPLWYMRYVEIPDWEVAMVATPLLQFDWYRADLHLMFPDQVPNIQDANLNEVFRAIIEHNGEDSVFFTFTTRFLLDSFDVNRVGDIFLVSPR